MRITEKIKDSLSCLVNNRSILISFLGDSVTQGCFELYRSGESALKTEYRSSSAYHNLLKKMIENVFPSVPINILNAGVSGDNAVSGYKRLKRDVISFNPDLVIVCFGLNDANKGISAIDEYTASLDAIFQELNSANIETIFMTPNMIATRTVLEEKDDYIRQVISETVSKQVDGTMDKYMDAARIVCQKNNIPICDCYKKWKKLEKNGADITRLLSNRVNHPNENMHYIFAYSLFDMIMGFDEN